jgi:hypothetical protein
MSFPRTREHRRPRGRCFYGAPESPTRRVAFRLVASAGITLPAQSCYRPEMAPQRLEKIESRLGNGMGSDASNLQHLVHQRVADREQLGSYRVAEKGA